LAVRKAWANFTKAFGQRFGRQKQMVRANL
jgi:hypothetical protein